MQATKCPLLVCEIPIICLLTETKCHLKCFKTSKLGAGPSKHHQILLPEPLDQCETQDNSTTCYRVLLEIQDNFATFMAKTHHRIKEATQGRPKGSQSSGKGKECTQD